MKTRLGALIVSVVVLWGCGSGDNTVVGPPPPPTPVAPTATPVRSSHPATPTPTPSCRNYKLCQGL